MLETIQTAFDSQTSERPLSTVWHMRARATCRVGRMPHVARLHVAGCDERGTDVAARRFGRLSRTVHDCHTAAAHRRYEALVPVACRSNRAACCVCMLCVVVHRIVHVARCVLCCAGSTRLVSKQVRISGATTAALASATQHWPNLNLTKRTL